MSIFSFKEKSIGVDLSDFSLKIAYLKKKRKGYVIKNLLEIEIPSGLVAQGEIKDQEKLFSIFKEVFKKIKDAGIRTRYITASLPEEKIFISVVQLPKMEEEEIESALGFEIEANIPYSLKDVYYDWELIPSANIDHLDVLVAAIPKKIVDSYLDIFKKAGFKPVVFEVESQAIARALVSFNSSDKNQNLPLLLIDLGATRTSFIIYSGGAIRFTSSIPVSSRDFTLEISKSLKISEKDAEDLKIKHGIERKGAEAVKIFDSLLPRLTTLIEKIQSLIVFYQSHAKHEHGRSLEFEKIILSGGGANLSGLSRYLSDELKNKVETADPFVNLGQYSKKDPNLNRVKGLSFATAIGLALRDISKEI